MSELDVRIAKRLRDLSNDAKDCELILLPNEPPDDWRDETKEHSKGFVPCDLAEVLRFVADMI